MEIRALILVLITRVITVNVLTPVCTPLPHFSSLPRNPYLQFYAKIKMLPSYLVLRPNRWIYSDALFLYPSLRICKLKRKGFFPLPFVYTTAVIHNVKDFAPLVGALVDNIGGRGWPRQQSWGGGVRLQESVEELQWGSECLKKHILFDITKVLGTSLQEFCIWTVQISIIDRILFSSFIYALKKYLWLDENLYLKRFGRISFSVFLFQIFVYH